MGAKLSCIVCHTSTHQDVDNPLLQIHTCGKRDGQYVCLNCIKLRLKRIQRYEDRIKVIPTTHPE